MVKKRQCDGLLQTKAVPSCRWHWQSNNEADIKGHAQWFCCVLGIEASKLVVMVVNGRREGAGDAKITNQVPRRNWAAEAAGIRDKPTSARTSKQTHHCTAPRTPRHACHIPREGLRRRASSSGVASALSSLSRFLSSTLTDWCRGDNSLSQSGNQRYGLQ